MLLTRSPLYSSRLRGTFSFDLHVLGTPPALILSQDQTLVWIRLAHRLPRPSCDGPTSACTLIFWSLPCRSKKPGGRASALPFATRTGRRSAFELNRNPVRLTWLAQLSCQRALGPDASGSPSWGRLAPRAWRRLTVLRAPVALTLSSIHLTEQFLMLPAPDPIVKVGRKEF